MKQRLREVRDKINYNNFVIEVRSKLEYLLWLIKNQDLANSSSSSSSSFEVPTVTTLPAIPTADQVHMTVFWTSDGGTGDDQEWSTYTGKTRWYPSWFPTSKSGVPV